MKWDFADRHLQAVYEKGRSKKYPFIDKPLARKFVERIGRIESAKDISDLMHPPSMHFEALKGFANRFSIRIDLKHRLEFEINFEDEKRTVGSIIVIKVSKHYE